MNTAVIESPAQEPPIRDLPQIVNRDQSVGERYRRPKRYKFRLLQGRHSETDRVYQRMQVRHPTLGTQVEADVVVAEIPRLYRRGDVFETDDNLAELFDKEGNVPKFERIVEGGEYGALVGTKDYFSRKPGEGAAAFMQRMTSLVHAAQEAATNAVGGEGVGTVAAPAPISNPPPPHPNQAKPPVAPNGVSIEQLNKMKPAELKAFAAENEIDIEGLRKPEEVVMKIWGEINPGRAL